ncbi:MAG: hypothetical protein ACE37B_08935 [Ilumatobacter sp.]|uniref:hypothetical protein n=1 Tax=Ilumatobacter sp. TaxID=1967498 RepID=UPI00391C2533
MFETKRREPGRGARRAKRTTSALSVFAMCAGAVVATTAVMSVADGIVSAAAPCTLHTSITKGVDDNFATANGIEAATPSADHVAFWQNAISPGLGFDDYDDATNNQWMAETFSGFNIPPTEQLCDATLTTRIKGTGDTNDSFGLFFVDQNDNTQRTADDERYIIPLSVSMTAQDFTFDLGDLTSPADPNGQTDLLPFIQQYGYVDFYVQDDNQTDFVKLDLYTSALITIEKTTNGEDSPDVVLGSPITWTYTITNYADQPAVLSSLVDSEEGVIELNDCESDGVIPAGESLTCTLTGIADSLDYCNDVVAQGVIEGYGEFDISDRSCYRGVEKCSAFGPEIVAGTKDSFQGVEPASPSAAVKDFYSANGAIGFRDFDDPGSDRFFAHTFTALEAPIGERICRATVAVNVDYRHSNDAVIFQLTGETTPPDRIDGVVYAADIAKYGPTPINTKKVLTFELGALTDGFVNTNVPSLLDQINAEGFLDVVVQDDSTVDYVSIQLYTEQVVEAGFNPLNPARILDSRVAANVGPFDTPWGPGETRAVPVTGVGGVPSTDVSAVVLNITTVNPSAPASWLTISPAGSTPTPTAALNFGLAPSATAVVNDVVVAKVGDGGTIDIRNANGDVHLVIEVSGYYSELGGSEFVGITPVRLLDSRAATNVGEYDTAWNAGVASDRDRSLQITGEVGVPATGVEAVALSITTVNPTALNNWLTIYPTGATRGQTASMFFGTSPATRQVVTDLVIAKIGDDGQINIFNQAGSVDLVVEVVGYFTTDVAAGSGYVATSPKRILDSRPATQVGPFATPWGMAGTRTVNVAAPGCEAVALNITSVKPTATFSWLSVAPSPGPVDVFTAVHTFGTAPYTGSVVNDLVVVTPDADGDIVLYNRSGTVDLVVDRVGVFGTC